MAQLFFTLNKKTITYGGKAEVGRAHTKQRGDDLPQTKKQLHMGV